jgi:hypothetical protein
VDAGIGLAEEADEDVINPAADLMNSFELSRDDLVDVVLSVAGSRSQNVLLMAKLGRDVGKEDVPALAPEREAPRACPVEVPRHVLQEKEIQHGLSRARAEHVELAVEDGRALSANQKPATLHFFRTHAANVPTDPSTIRAGVIELGGFYMKLVVARMRHQLVTLITDGGTHVGRTIYPALGFYVDVFGVAHTEYITCFEYVSATKAAIVADFSRLIQYLEENGVHVVAVETDNAPALKGAFAMAPRNPKAPTVQKTIDAPLLEIACGIHTSLLVFPDGIKAVPLFRDAIAWVLPGVHEVHSRSRAAFDIAGGGDTGQVPADPGREAEH